MRYLGDYALGQTVRFAFSTAAATGARADFNSALETADLRLYRNLGATERASQAGYAVTSAFDSLTGITAVSLDTSDNTDAGFWLAGADYTVVLYPDETLDGQAVAAVLAEFSIENRLPNLRALPSQAVGAVPSLGILARGTAQSVTDTTVRLAASETFGDDTLIGCIVGVFGSSQGYWQWRAVTDYVASTDTATVDTWTVTPSGTITYLVLAGAPASVTTPIPTQVVSMANNVMTAAATAADFVAELTSSSTGDWTTTERNQIRQRLGIDGTAATPSATPALALAGDAMALTAGAATALVRAMVRALNGADGYAITKDIPNNRLVLTIPGVGNVNIPASFNADAIGVDSLG